jgi:uncharacterized membrane protein YdjX (TVP38/TMEM64 family)
VARCSPKGRWIETRLRRLAYAQERLGCSNPVETVSALIEYVQSLGASGYALFAVTMVALQVVPVANAFLLTVTAGAIFGALPGTLLVLLCSTVGASTAFVVARTFARDAVLSAAEGSPSFVAINDAFAKADFQTSLTLITLLRVSPAVPFVWGNYLFGLSPLPLPTFALGTFFGCAPAVAVYVSAGQVGADVAVNGAGTNPYLLALGIAATVGAVSVAGNVASDALMAQGGGAGRLRTPDSIECVVARVARHIITDDVSRDINQALATCG